MHAQTDVALNWRDTKKATNSERCFCHRQGDSSFDTHYHSWDPRIAHREWRSKSRQKTSAAWYHRCTRASQRIEKRLPFRKNSGHPMKDNQRKHRENKNKALTWKTKNTLAPTRFEWEKEMKKEIWLIVHWANGPGVQWCRLAAKWDAQRVAPEPLYIHRALAYYKRQTGGFLDYRVTAWQICWEILSILLLCPDM